MEKINKFFKDKLVKLNTSNKESLIPLVKRAIFLTSVGVDSNDSLKRFLFLKKELKRTGIRVDQAAAKKIILASTCHDDIAYNLVKHALKSRGLAKVAYPNPGLDPDSLHKEVDLNAWIDIVHNVYRDCKSGKRSKQEAVDFYSNTLDNEERFDFLRWLDHHLSGEGFKYAANKGGTMEKKSVFQSDLGQGNNPYAHDGSGYYFQNRNFGNNMPGDSFPEGVSTKKDSDLAPAGPAAPREYEGKSGLAWKRSLDSACRRLDKLLRENNKISDADYSLMAQNLFDLSMNIRTVSLASTAGDLTYKAASNFNKAGFPGYANELLKLAQQAVEEAPLEPPEEELGATEPPVAERGPPGEPPDSGARTGPSAQESKSGVSVPEPDEVEQVKLRDIEPIPGPAPGEYDFLAGDITLEDAAAKLDQVAGMLADRRIIRQLAEFDIMLDKIGVASMFPELAESQSKLIDSFSYALTRVTKMMGQLSNAKSLLAAGGGRVPGATPQGDITPGGSPLPPTEPEGIPEEGLIGDDEVA